MGSLGKIVFLASLGAVSLAQNSSFYDPYDAPMFQLSSDATQAFSLINVLSLANNNGANIGEVLRVATQILPSNDEEATYNAFYPMARAISALAESVDPTVDPVAARENYFHAATYYRGSLDYLTGNQSDPRLVSVWDQQIAAFDKAVALLKPVPAEKFTVRAQNSSIGPYNIPGYFYKAYADNSTKVPTFIITTGYDGSQQESYHSQCIPILKRGLNCATMEGPGQPSPRKYQNIGFIPDWWTATTPIVDYLVNRPDVDPEKIVLMGISFGGSLTPRAFSREPRLSTLVMLDGLPSLQQKLGEDLPPEIWAAFNASRQTPFNDFIFSLTDNTSLPLGDRYIFQQGLYAFDTKSPFDWFTRLGEIAITPEVVAGAGQRPVYIAKGQDDTLTGTQANLAYNMFVSDRPNGKNLTYFHEFLDVLGAGLHCSEGAETQVFTSVTTWLSGVWGGYKFDNNDIVG